MLENFRANVLNSKSKVRPYESLEQTPQRTLSRKTFRNLENICGTEVTHAIWLKNYYQKSNSQGGAQCLKERTKHKKII